MALGRNHVVLAEALEALKTITDRHGSSVLESEDLSRAHRESLVANGFLEPVIRGWLAVSKPGAQPRVQTMWGSVYWDFVARYLQKRFGQDYWLDATASLRIHAENRKVPDQIVVCTPAKMNDRVDLPNGNSIYVYGAPQPILPTAIVVKGGLRMLSPETTIAMLPVSGWSTDSTDAATVLGSIKPDATLLRAILADGKTVRAGAIAGALRQIGRPEQAEEIIRGVRDAGHDIREQAPLDHTATGKIDNDKSPKPAAARIELLWEKLRLQVLEEFSLAPKKINDVDGYLAEIDERYVSDAYNSLSIEGYQVSAELIERVKAGNWKPETDPKDFDIQNVLAARGYWLAFSEVKQDMERILKNEEVAPLLWKRHQEWYKAMFRPFVTAQIMKEYQLTGYRGSPVYLFGSKHVPYSPDAVTDGMEALFKCLGRETDPRVKAILAPFLFTYIHPYMDGNGRNGRFLMNALLAEGGFPWTVVPYNRRHEYMACLEAARSQEDIRPLSRFIAELVQSPPPPRPGKSHYSAQSTENQASSNKTLAHGEPNVVLEEQREALRRVKDLQNLETHIGPRKTFWRLASQELAERPYTEIDWRKVEMRTAHESIADHGQSPEDVIEAIFENSPGAVTSKQKTEISLAVMRHSDEWAAAYEESLAKRGPRPGPEAKK